nr:hypothetical protein [Tanacetum cinerariifolium]
EYPWGKSLAAIELGMASTRLAPVPESAPADVSDPDPLSFANPQSRHPADVAQCSQGTVAAGDPESENASFAFAVRSPESIYRPELGMANGSLLDTPEACQDLVDHVAPPDLQVSNNRLTQQVATLQEQVSGEEKLKAAFEEFKRYEDGRVELCCAEMNARLDALSIDFDEELYPHMLTAIVGRRWMIGHGLRLAVGDIRPSSSQLTIPVYLEVRDPVSPWACKEEMLLVDAIAANVSRAKKKKKCRIVCRTHGVGSAHHARSDGVPVSAPTVVPQGLALLLADVSGEEKLKAAFEEFKRYEDERVEQRCAELDARLDALSIDFDEELYPYMLTTIAGRRWVVGHGLRLAMMKCAESLEMRQAFVDVVSAGVAKGMSEGLKHGVEHGRAQLKVESIEAYDPEAKAKFAAALQSLKDLKATLSQLTIPVYPEVRDPRNPWAYKEEMKLSDAIAANITRAKKKKKCRIVCRTHGVGSAHHARSDGVPVSVPTVVPQGLALLLVDAATQTGFEDT